MGFVEQAKGKVKQVAGDLTGSDGLKAEGEAQVDKGYEETKETEARAKAEAHEKKAEIYENKQELADKAR